PHAFDPHTVAAYDRAQLATIADRRVAGEPHLGNLDRWKSLLDHRDVPGLHRFLTGLSRDCIEMREVSAMGGLLTDNEGIRVCARCTDAPRPTRARHPCRLPNRDLTKVIIVGSRAILGTYTDAGRPFYAARSVD